MPLPLIVDEIQSKHGDSSKESREGVIKAHGDIDNIKIMAGLWACNHNILGNERDIVIAYVTAVDLGFRMGMNKQEATYDK